MSCQHRNLSGVKVQKYPLFSLFLVALSLCQPVWAKPADSSVLREAKVAGQFYPDEAGELRGLIKELLQRQPEPALKTKPRILIVPHAGYQYSGLIAANAYRQLQGYRYDGVVVVGFTHRSQFPGSSADNREAYVTPLGEIPVNQEAAAILRTYPGVDFVEAAHAGDEHSLEVQLPFLQVMLGRFRLVPVLMGQMGVEDAHQLATALNSLTRFGDYLFVFSTDLSHYHTYDEANKLDERTVAAILQETPQAVSRLFDANQLEACGRGPIITSLFLSARLGYLKKELLYQANSGDTWGPADKVVGYAAIEMYGRTQAAPKGGINAASGRQLVKAARLALNMQLKPEKFKNRQVALGLDKFSDLSQARGLFVTLRKQSQLRGCIGRIQTDQPLKQSLSVVAVDSALRDPRFPPVTPEELDRLHIEVSVLTKPVKVASAAEIVPGRDGVVLEAEGHSGVFLPQVWDETGWTRVEFLRELANQKAGLSPDAWQQADLYTFQAQVFEE